MKPLSSFISALALALVIVPAMAPMAEGTPISSSEYSVYRVWSDITYEGETEYFNGNITALMSTNSVLISGEFQVDWSSAPYLMYADADYSPGYVYMTASMTLCWLDDDLQKQTLDVSRNGYGQAPFGRIYYLLYRYEYNTEMLWEDVGLIPTSRAVWLEDITVSIVSPTMKYWLETGKNYIVLAEWSVSAAFCEQICLLASYTSDESPDFQISDRWNHPSTSASWWQGAMDDDYVNEWHGAKHSAWTYMSRDWTRHEAILDDCSTDDVTNRSRLYGYAESMLSKIESVLTWQHALVKDTLGSPYLMAIDADGDDFSTGAGKAKDAYDRCKALQKQIRSGGDYGEIQEELTRALRDYQLAILYTDREIMTNGLENVNFGAEDLENYIETQMNAPIKALETEARYNPAEPAGPSQFMLWISSGSNAVILGAAVALAGVAVIWRSGFVALMAVAAAAVAALSYMGGIS